MTLLALKTPKVDRSIGARYELLREAQRLLYDAEAQKQHRTCWCLRRIESTGGQVTMFRRADGTGARLGNLMRCGGVWTCPVCAQRVSEARREELQAGMQHWRREGRAVYLMSLTFPHAIDDAPDELVPKFERALKRFKQSRGYRKLDGHEGSVRGLEVTWGQNGWHPHTHELLFIEKPIFGSSEGKAALSHPLIDGLRAAWIDSLIREGLATRDQVNDMWLHALDVRGGAKAADYVAGFGRDDAKWGLADELTRAHAKIGARGSIGSISDHVTPFQVLAWAAAGDRLAARLFIDYARAFKGSRMLYWSPGLKARLGLADTDDAALAAKDDMPEEVKLGSISIEELASCWARGAVGELVDAMRSWTPDNAPDQFRIWFARLMARPRIESGRVIVRKEFLGREERLAA